MAEHGLGISLTNKVKRAGSREQLVTLLLLFILLSASITSITTVLTGPDWTLLWESLLIGLLAGWGMAIFLRRFWLSALLAVGLGLLFCLLSAGGLSGKAWDVISEIIRLPGYIPAWVKTREIDLSLLANATQQLFSSTGVVLNRVIPWVRNLATGQATFDPVAAGLVWGMVVWLVSAWAGWMIEAHHNTLIAVLPALGLNLSILSYGRSNTRVIYLTLGITLLLVALVQYDQRRQEWDSTKVAYPQRKGRQVGNTSLVISIGLVVLAAIISSSSLRRIEQLASRINPNSAQDENSLAKSLGIQQPSPVPSAFSTALAPGLPRDLLIGARPELLREQVMSVKVNDLPGLLQNSQLPPLYWRSYTYDIYTGHGWRSSATEQTTYQPDQPLQPGQLPGHQLIEETIIPAQDQAGTVYAAGEPATMNVSTTAAWRSNHDLFGIQTPSNSYIVQSLIPVASEDSLRAAGENYPGWVTQRYLAVPVEVPSRVKQLAIQLTATQPTPYDRVRAIEQYLRSTYSYTTDVPYPPANQDLADYFLFDLREGYCDYYASAMVVLARAAGIPARLAIGYATGTYNLNSGRFIVTQADSHSWVEVYFPGVGWVPFEPTAARPEINRSGQPVPQVTSSATPSVGTPGPGSTNPSGLILGYTALGGFALLAIAYTLFDELHLRQLAPRMAAVEVYRRLQRYGRLLKIPAEIGQTPGEYASAITSHMVDNVHWQPAKTALLAPEIKALIHYIVRLSYRPSEPGEASKLQLLNRWRSLRWQLRSLWILSLWNEIRLIFRRKRPGEMAIRGSGSQE